MLDSKTDCVVAVSKCRLKSAVPILRDIKIPHYSVYPALHQIQATLKFLIILIIGLTRARVAPLTFYSPCNPR